MVWFSKSLNCICPPAELKAMVTMLWDLGIECPTWLNLTKYSEKSIAWLLTELAFVHTSFLIEGAALKPRVWYVWFTLPKTNLVTMRNHHLCAIITTIRKIRIFQNEKPTFTRHRAGPLLWYLPTNLPQLPVNISLLTARPMLRPHVFGTLHLQLQRQRWLRRGMCVSVQRSYCGLSLWGWYNNILLIVY